MDSPNMSSSSAVEVSEHVSDVLSESVGIYCTG